MRVLAKLGILDTATRTALERLRSFRNKVAHRGDLATREQAEQAILIGKKLLGPLVQGS